MRAIALQCWYPVNSYTLDCKTHVCTHTAMRMLAGKPSVPHVKTPEFSKTVLERHIAKLIEAVAEPAVVGHLAEKSHVAGSMVGRLHPARDHDPPGRDPEQSAGPQQTQVQILECTSEHAQPIGTTSHAVMKGWRVSLDAVAVMHILHLPTAGEGAFIVGQRPVGAPAEVHR